MKKKVGFVSLGCAKNRVDSEKMMGLIREGGLDITSDPQEADYIFVNTCGFIRSAKEESIDTILDMADYKKGKCQKLIVTGCLAQRYAKELAKDLPEVDRVIPIEDYPRLTEILTQEIGAEYKHPNPSRLLSTDPWMAYLKISDGCYNRCAYCAIPLIKGNYESEPFEQLVKEAEGLAKSGVKEINLVAQDTTMYGVDLYKRKRLGELVKAINAIEGIRWIRILYLYPSQVDEQLLQQLKSCDKFVPYFDLPMQYGDDRMLKLMDRHTSIQQFRDTVKLIRQYFPDAVLRSTMIVGFPGETEQDFNELKQFIQEMKFDRLGAFTYSREEGTKAYDMKPQIHWKTKQRRLKELMQLQSEISQEVSQRFVGKTLDVLLEKTDPDTGVYMGRSYASAPDEIDGYVYVSTPKAHPLGSFVPVTITSSAVYDLVGQEVGIDD